MDFDGVGEFLAIDQLAVDIFDIDALIEHDMPVERILADDRARLAKSSRDDCRPPAKIAPFRIEQYVDPVAEMEIIAGHKAPRRAGAHAVSLPSRPKNTRR